MQQQAAAGAMCRSFLSGHLKCTFISCVLIATCQTCKCGLQLIQTTCTDPRIGHKQQNQRVQGIAGLRNDMMSSDVAMADGR